MHYTRPFSLSQLRIQYLLIHINFIEQITPKIMFTIRYNWIASIIGGQFHTYAFDIENFSSTRVEVSTYFVYFSILRWLLSVIRFDSQSNKVWVWHEDLIDFYIFFDLHSTFWWCLMSVGGFLKWEKMNENFFINFINGNLQQGA